MNNCATCGKPMRLGGMRITVDRRRGVSHYVAHMDSSPMHETGWACAMFKPYPKRDEDKDWFKMIDRWNAANPPSTNEERNAP